MKGMQDIEQFVARMRRMIRSSAPFVVVNVSYSLFPFIRQDRQLLRIQHNGAQELAAHFGAEFWPMPDMDAFVVFPESVFRNVPEFIDRVIANFFPDRVQDDLDQGQLVQRYTIPGDYANLRVRANDYLEAAARRAPCAAAAPQPPAERRAELEGPLNARLVSHLEDAVEGLDVGRYLRSQTVYRVGVDGSWQPFYCEYFTGMEDLHRENFPKVQLAGQRRLFHEFCQCLDEKMLSGLSAQRAEMTGAGDGAIGINLGIKSVFGPLLSNLGRATARIARNSVVVELDILLLLEDVAAGRRATAMLRDQGYRIAVDGITLDLLGYISPERFDADFFKVHVAHDRLSSLNDPESVGALRRLGRERVIFSRCDHEMAVTVGRAIGCDKFQGRLIDQLAGAAGH
ncbi:MAG TPA: hypothetical protein VD978_36390 [Azospirillum sp.]|nr:hypothetical protein [Azospirillum sp.]